MQKTLFLFLSLFLSGTLVSQLTVNTFDEALHQGANTITDDFSFPDDISMYSEIYMHFHLSCPPGGCDPWDRFANIKVEKNGVEYEIGRYVTPYANDWCDWTLDVSAYRELLQGEVTLKSYIETWSNGWEITVDFEFIEGVPDYAYARVENLWVDYFLIYGDTIFYSINLEELDVNVPENAEQTIVRIVNTGHGQGNTLNAAEFSHMTHYLWVDGVDEFEQDHWKSDCDVNPCSPQAGTWQFARAGWCPGEEVTPWDRDITDLVTPGEEVALDYVLEPYFNSCSPWNPDCNDGQTCNECTYNGGTHTQPNYKISSQIIFYSNTEFTSDIPILDISSQLQLFPNPANDVVNLVFKGNGAISSVVVMDMEGELVHAESGIRSYLRSLDTSNLAAGIYLLRAEVNGQWINKRLQISK